MKMVGENGNVWVKFKQTGFFLVTAFSFVALTFFYCCSKQVKCLGKYLSISFIWNCFKWFFSGVEDSCGFDNFPSLGLAAFKNT